MEHSQCHLDWFLVRSSTSDFFRLQHFLCIGDQHLEHRTPLSILVLFFLHTEQKSIFLLLFAISPNF